MRDSDVVPVVLGDDEHQDILNNLILPEWTRGAVRQEQPVLIVVAGPPGSNKTGVADVIHAVLGRRGGAVRIGSDLYKHRHPRYTALVVEDDRTAGIRVRPDTRRWQAEVEEYVRRHRFDAVVESAAADPDQFRADALAYRASGYRIEVVAVTAAEALTQLRAVSRYLRERRHVSWENHDDCARGLLETLAIIESEQLVDQVTVVRPGIDFVYRSEVVSGAWLGEPAAAVRVVQTERWRPWSARQTAAFSTELYETQEQVHQPQVTRDQRLVVAGPIERARALAEPVRRIAQVRPDAPGVHYHQLSRGEHQWLYDELIAPSYLDGVTAQEEPVAVIVVGEPGAEVSRTANLVQRAMGSRAPVRLVYQDFEAFHPDSEQVCSEHPLSDGAEIRADVEAWMARIATALRGLRAHVIVESFPGSVQEVLGEAELYGSAGFRVDLVLLGARAADSRQATARIHARLQQRGVPSRYTSRTRHDQVRHTVAQLARIAETHPAIASVLVLGPDGDAVHRNERTARGGLTRPIRAAAALGGARVKPYTLTEANRFLTTHRALRAALPQHRDDLHRTLALAHPLMPAALRPPSLPCPARPLYLPVPLPGPLWGRDAEPPSHGMRGEHERSRHSGACERAGT
ncbi:zeta toxin family protein [Streptomyces sp. ASQP_92]|uniref:zeta toxin family protein n=1 Tax=Streptomyces sp. ASQP_92 TaxID=2979116 RepID=UPI0021BE69BE|nr:zeta toxin family protein [Streptomyces sp. ASQP_92]MCT9093502.1 zeta toxin family protein [Streptomyces sp. ASQP_92]